MNLNETHIQSLKHKNMWAEDCPVHYSQLSLLQIPFHNFDGFSQIGQIMVASAVSEKVQNIFSELYDLKFPIHSLLLMDEFFGNDLKSMEANNSSAYNGRRIMNTERWSSHAYGVAIDINPKQNPYLQFDHHAATIKVYPSSGLNYVNRGVNKSGMLEEIVPIFAKYGFTEWGGSWDTKPDYHHFQLPWDDIKSMFPKEDEN